MRAAAPTERGSGSISTKVRWTQRPSYRWIVLFMGFLAVFGAIGFGRFGYSAILPAMQADLDISSAAAGALASWNLGGYVLMAAVGGILASRFGPRAVAGIGLLVAALGMLLTGFANGMVGGLGRSPSDRRRGRDGSGALHRPDVGLV